VSEPRHPVQTRLGQRALGMIGNKRVFPYLVGVTALVAVGAALVARLIDKTDFPSFGVALWWAVVTLSTVGYGDVVPHTGWGRLLGSVVILFGVTFIALLIAIVTALFVDAGDEQRDVALQERHDELVRLVRDLDERIARMEARQNAG
jgi:voltage-gated potassium channel